jgi:hypothetical protein
VEKNNSFPVLEIHMGEKLWDFDHYNNSADSDRLEASEKRYYSYRFKYFIRILFDDDNTGEAWWNGLEGESHAHDYVGVVVRRGYCWHGKHSKICYWPYPSNKRKANP